MSAYRPTFLSHAHADNTLCDRYAAALSARRIDAWYDRNNAQVGHLLGNEIQAELQRRSAFVLLLTQHALDSFWVNLETQTYLGLMAQDRTRLLLSVRIGPCVVPPMLNAFLWIDALALGFDAAIDALAAALTMRDAPPVPLGPAPPHPHTLPTHPGPAPTPAGATPAHHLTPISLYNLGFRGWTVNGVECVLPPLCPVPAGVFIMGSDKAQDKDAEDDETPQYPVPVGDFSIGQHPVTVAEYACAVRAKAVRVPPEGAYVKTTWDQQLQRLDHPVVCLSWQDAIAYAAWLAKLTRQPWRLPTEAEWEKMARWDASAGPSGHARRYPWGNTFDKTKCNTAESGIKTTTPVGRYPGGASPYGAQDVAGNVWEWTSSLFKPYAYNQNDGREDRNSTENRVRRGGSWFDVAWYARAACRDRDGPDFLDDSDGFRLVLVAAARAGS